MTSKPLPKYITGKNLLNKIIKQTLGLPVEMYKENLLLITDYSKEDSSERLVNFHYNPDEVDKILMGGIHTYYTRQQIATLANTRGIIVDFRTESIVMRSFPRTSIITCNQVPNDTLLPIKVGDNFITPDGGVYKRRFGGVLLRVFENNGIVHACTHKKIDASKSFFGDRVEFTKYWLNDQNVFPSFESLYTQEDLGKKIIHLFIINNRKLLVDSRENQRVDRIVYIKSYSLDLPNEYFDLSATILSINPSCTKPITLPEILSPYQVNSILLGNLTSNNQDLLKFSGGEQIIYENSITQISMLSSESSRFRQQIMEGKLNINELFIKSVANTENENFANIAFSLPDLHDIQEKFENNEIVNIDMYQLNLGSSQMKILTNLIFIVPLSRINECFEANENFDKLVIETIDYFMQIADELENEILTGEINNNTNLSKKLKQYIILNFKNSKSILMNNITAPRDNWANSARELYNQLVEAEFQSEIENLNLKLAMICFVSNASSEIFYSLLNYKRKVDKAIIAHRKHEEKNNL